MANKTDELYSIRVGDCIYYIDVCPNKLESGKVTTIIHEGAEGGNLTLDDYHRCWFKDFDQLWFTDCARAENTFRKIHEGRVRFGDTVRLVDDPDKGYGVVADVDYAIDQATNKITAAYKVAFEHERLRCREGDLERIGNAFSDISTLVDARRDALKNALLNILIDSPKYRNKRKVDRKEIIELIETTEQ